MSFIIFTLLSLNLYATPRTETINDVVVSSDKNNDTRNYRGMLTKKISRNIQNVKAAILNFEQKCNNDLSRKRTLTSREMKCTYFNENLIESLVVKDLKQPQEKEDGEVNRFVIVRRAYNRGLYSHYEITTEKEHLNSQKQKVITITQKMIPSDKVTNYIEKPLVESNSVFNTTKGTFVLTEISPTETQFDYEYYAETDHWVLNKEISVSQVFSSITKSLNDLWVSIDQESEKLMRSVASKH